MAVPAAAEAKSMLLQADIPSFTTSQRLGDLPGGSGGIPMEGKKRELHEAVRTSSVTLLDAATATGQLLDPIAEQM